MSDRIFKTYALGGFEPLAAQALSDQDQNVEPDSLFQTGVEQFHKGQLQQALAIANFRS